MSLCGDAAKASIHGKITPHDPNRGGWWISLQSTAKNIFIRKTILRNELVRVHSLSFSPLTQQAGGGSVEIDRWNRPPFDKRSER